jgi:hypothetical protein
MGVRAGGPKFYDLCMLFSRRISAARLLVVAILAGGLSAGCRPGSAPPTTQPERPQAEEPAPVAAQEAPEAQGEAAAEADLERLQAEVQRLEAAVAGLQLRLIESETNAATLQTKLDAAIREAVRSKAKLQSVESRAEAASTIAEAEIALDQRRAAERSNPRLIQAAELLEMSATEFDAENYGGALYLAAQAKELVSDNPARLGDPTRRDEEVPFTLSLPLRALRSSNVRRGPGTTFEVLFVLEEGAEVMGHAYERQWVRITTPDGRSGWIYSTLVDSR